MLSDALVTSNTILDSKEARDYKLNPYNKNVMADLDKPGEYLGEDDDNLFRQACYMIALRKANPRSQALKAKNIVDALNNADWNDMGEDRDSFLAMVGDPATSDDKFNACIKKVFKDTKDWLPMYNPSGMGINDQQLMFFKSIPGNGEPMPSFSADTVDNKSQSNTTELESEPKPMVVPDQSAAQANLGLMPIKTIIPGPLHSQQQETPSVKPKPAQVVDPNNGSIGARDNHDLSNDSNVNNVPLIDQIRQIITDNTNSSAIANVANAMVDNIINNPNQYPEEIKDLSDPLRRINIVSAILLQAEQSLNAPATRMGTPATQLAEPKPVVAEDESEEEEEEEDNTSPAPSTNRSRRSSKPTTQIDEPAPETPVTASEELRNRVYSTIDEKAMSPEQAAEARAYADVVLDDPETYPNEFDALNNSRRFGPFIAGLLRTANKRLGFKDAGKADDRINFAGGRISQSRRGSGARSAFVSPEGFGTKKATVLWNQPVITEFGFPFLNFSSEALLRVLRAKNDEDIQNDQLKAMFKDAKKRYGGVWKAIYAAPLSLIKQISHDKGTRCTPCYLKVDGNELIDSEPGEDISVTPIQYYSVDAAYDEPVSLPRDFVSSFYDVIDYSSSSKRTYMKYSDGMTADDFAEAVDENGGIPPFYILVPKKAMYSRCDIRPGSLFGSLLNLILGRKPCSLVKTILDGKRGCLVMDEDIADAIFVDV